MDRTEHAKIKITDIQTEFINEYNLQYVTHNRGVYFENFKGCYGLPQSGKISNNLLFTRLNKAGYYESATTPGLWKHTWLTIQFSLSLIILELNMWGGNIPTTSAKFSKSSKNIMKYKKIRKGDKFSGIDLEWNYVLTHNYCTCGLSIKGCIEESLLNLATSAQPNISSCTTNIMKFIMEPKYKRPLRK